MHLEIGVEIGKAIDIAAASRNVSLAASKFNISERS